MPVSRSGAIMYAPSEGSPVPAGVAKYGGLVMRYLHTMLRVRDLDARARFLLQQARPQGGAPPGRREEQVHAGVPGGARG